MRSDPIKVSNRDSAVGVLVLPGQVVEAPSGEVLLPVTDLWLTALGDQLERMGLAARPLIEELQERWGAATRPILIEAALNRLNVLPGSSLITGKLLDIVVFAAAIHEEFSNDKGVQKARHVDN
jgi:hypothetical protein